jgi:Ca2+-binding RTX toxin-like protein
MIGGLGNDTFHVDQAGDAAVEAANSGTDTVLASITYSLAGQYIENLTLTGGNAINGTGNSLANIITGNGAANILDGGEGNDTIDGGAGADTMIGGVGDDTFYVDNAGDTVTEFYGQGTDTVISTVTFSLAGQYLENLTLAGSSAINGTGNKLNNTLIGNGAANTLTGGEGNDLLDGGAGADTLIGGVGDDTYIVDNAGDTVTEAANSGTDSVFSSVSFSLAGQYIENLTLTGVAAVNGTGNSLANVLTGNSAANTLSGMDGNDSIHGGLGADTLTGGQGSDGFYFDTALGGGNVDTITDFNVAADTIYLEGTVFTDAGPSGVLAAGAFVNGSVALDADDRILYDSATGNIYYDADGSGAGAAVQFAKVTAGTALTRADFVIENGVEDANAIVSISCLFGAEDNMALVRFTLAGESSTDDRGSAEIVAVESVTRADMIHARAAQSAVLSITDLLGHDALDLGSAADAILDAGVQVADDAGFLPMVDAAPQHTQLLGANWAHDTVI